MDRGATCMLQKPFASQWISVGPGAPAALSSGIGEKRGADECDGPAAKIPRQVEPFIPEIIPYGTFYILGYNGFIPPFNRGRVRSYCQLLKKHYGNGVKYLRTYDASNKGVLKAALASKLHSVIYKLSISESVVVEYTKDPNTDMFQIGRSAEPPIDFVVVDVDRVAGKTTKSTVSRYACRVLCDRANCKDVRVFAAGFDESRNIFLGEKAIKWHAGQTVDSLTSNAILINHPKGDFWGGAAEPAPWRELSVGGNLYTLRPSRQSKVRGTHVEEESNLLKDGSLIDLCGATLLWRSAEGLAKSISKKELRQSLCKSLTDSQAVNDKSELNTFLIPLVNTQSEKKDVPYVHLNCGHLQNKLGAVKNLDNVQCPVCLEFGPATQLCVGIESAFYVDRGPLFYAFNPCGHLANKKTVLYWSKVQIPNRNNTFEPRCPFCATPLAEPVGYVRLQHID